MNLEFTRLWVSSPIQVPHIPLGTIGTLLSPPAKPYLSTRNLESKPPDLAGITNLSHQQPPTFFHITHPPPRKFSNCSYPCWKTNVDIHWSRPAKTGGGVDAYGTLLVRDQKVYVPVGTYVCTAASMAWFDCFCGWSFVSTASACGCVPTRDSGGRTPSPQLTVTNSLRDHI